MVERKCLVVTGGIALGLIIVLIGVLVNSIKKLETFEVALKYDVHARKLGKEPTSEGLYAYIPGFKFITFPSVTDTIKFEGLECLNIDGITIQLWVTYQYKPRTHSLYELVTQFRDHDNYKTILEYVGSSAIRDVCSRFNVTHFQQDRSSFQVQVRDRLTTRYSEMGSDIIEVQVNNINRPYAYEETISQKEGAREDVEVAHQEEPLKLTQAETKLKNSEKEATIKINKARSDAKIAIARATAEAESLLHSYDKEAETYQMIVSDDGFGFDTDAFLNYLGVRVLEDAHQDIYVNMEEPVSKA